MVTLLKRKSDTLTCVYLCMLTAYTLLREVVVLNPIMQSELLSIAFFGAGFLLIGFNWLYNRATFQIRNMWLLIGFVAVTTISTLINYKYGFMDNAKAVGWMCIYFFLLYPTGYQSDSHRDCNRTVNAVLITAIVTMTLIIAVSLPMYFLNIGYRGGYSSYSGSHSSHGFNQKYMRLWGVFHDPNYAGVHAGVTFLATIYMFIIKRKVFTRIALAIAGAMMIIYIVLSGSRTVLLSFMVVCCWVAFYIVATHVNYSRIKKIIVAAVSAVLSVLLCYLVIYGLRVSLPYVKYGLQSITSKKVSKAIHLFYDDAYRWSKTPISEGFYVESPDQEPDSSIDEEIDIEILDRPDINDKSDVSNGRLRLWGETLQVFTRVPIFGTSPRSISEVGFEFFPDSKLGKHHLNTHNSFLEVLTGTGILGFAFMMLILLKTASSILKTMMEKRYSKRMLLLSSLALLMVVSSAFESDLYFILSFGGVIFWLTLGNLAHKEIRLEREEMQSDKKRVLVYGLKDPAGGVEKQVFEYAKHITDKHNIAFDFIIIGDSFSMEEEIKALGCRCLYVPSRRKNSAAYKKAMNAIFTETRYIAVWGNYSGLTNIDLLIEAKRYGVPVRIVHSHCTRLYWTGALMRIIVPIMHYFNKLRLTGYANRYWACSQQAGRFMFPKSTYKDIELINNAVDFQKFFPDEESRKDVRRDFNIDDSTVVVGHVARMCEVKNQGFLLSAFANVKKQNSDSKLLFVGDGELKDELLMKAERLNITDSVIFTGERNDVPELLRAMDVFVLPSLAEGLSVSAVEAQASGLPCVMSTAVSVKTDISGNCRFVDLSASYEEWANTILETAGLKPQNPKGKIAENGYDITVEAEKLYDRLLGE